MWREDEKEEQALAVIGMSSRAERALDGPMRVTRSWSPAGSASRDFCSRVAEITVGQRQMEKSIPDHESPLRVAHSEHPCRPGQLS